MEKDKFTELAEKTLSIGPQIVSHNNNKVVVISKAEYDNLREKKIGFKEYLLNPPHSMEDIKFERDQSSMRIINL